MAKPYVPRLNLTLITKSHTHTHTHTQIPRRFPYRFEMASALYAGRDGAGVWVPHGGGAFARTSGLLGAELVRGERWGDTRWSGCCLYVCVCVCVCVLSIL